MAIKFEWDPRKAAANLRKHRIGFPEATTAFGDPLSMTIPDPDHSDDEERLLLLGQTEAGRLLVVAHIERGANIRIISDRLAAPSERRVYEEG